MTVIATVHPNKKPEAAIIQFAVTKDLWIVFNTFSTYSKYKNLKENAAVAFAFGGEEKITVQYEGEARELEGEELQEYKSTFLTKNPQAKKWDAIPETCWFVVYPKWIRYADLRRGHSHKQELDFLV